MSCNADFHEHGFCLRHILQLHPRWGLRDVGEFATHCMPVCMLFNLLRLSLCMLREVSIPLFVKILCWCVMKFFRLRHFSSFMLYRLYWFPALFPLRYRLCHSLFSLPWSSACSLLPIASFRSFLACTLLVLISVVPCASKLMIRPLLYVSTAFLAYASLSAFWHWVKCSFYIPTWET